MDDAETQYRRLQVLYKKAEDAIHTLGIENSGVDVSAINELRYVGNHLLTALTTSDEQIHNENIQRAKRHCKRALYDAYDGAIFYQIELFKQFKSDYATTPILDVLTDIVEIEQSFKQAKSLLKQARNNFDNREEYYAKVEKVYPSIEKAVERVEAAREELNKKRVKSRRFWVTPSAIIFSSILSATIALIIAKCKF